MHRTDIAIVGAGLSGLALADRLMSAGREVTLFEARARAGGRILSQDGFDLGPAWIWPHNRRMLSLVDRLDLSTFAQHSQGRLVFEDEKGEVRKDLDFATMGGALRVTGGLARITDTLAARAGDRLRLDHAVRRVDEDRNGVTLTGDGWQVRTAQAVIALPPRLAAGLDLAVPDTPTWMAGHAKLVAIYETPFWRDDSLNGDAISHRGPLAEVHDAAPADAEQGALFGFAHPGAARQADFKAAAIAQLARLFGPDAARPTDVLVKDWSTDAATATPADLAPVMRHPSYRAIPSTRHVIFAGTETAPVEGGFLEGALEAAEAAHDALRTPVTG